MNTPVSTRLRARYFAQTALMGLLGLALTACVSTKQPGEPSQAEQAALATGVERYQARTDEPFPVAAVDTKKIGDKYLKQIVDYKTDYPAGTIVVDPASRFLYLVKDGGKAVRYGVGVGKAGFEFSGTAHVGFKRQWPRWTPTPDMLARDPRRYGKWADGMEGGDKNPLGARAMYLMKDGKDTLYRIHGTNEPWTVGTAASSGCIRMLNQDVIDLYNQVSPGAQVVVLGADGSI
ncbi:L,D-transpeptidase [Pannonibacter phragmitetus]